MRENDGATGQQSARVWAARPAAAAHYALPLCALAGLAALLAPRSLWAFEVYGDSLDLTQRSYRTFADFRGPFANTNQTPDPDFPGSVGAELALRKGVAEWGSRPHGSGLTDPLQDVIGSGGANFDAFWAGRAVVAGNTNGNVVSVIAGGGPSFAFTELPIGDGWRIRFFDLARGWSDSPLGPAAAGPNGMDIQGVMTHEFGHALGLDHTAVSGATMAQTTSDNGVDLRSLEADDIDGVQFIYGVAAPDKPVVLGYALLPGGVVRIEGEHFDAVANDVWFTDSAEATTGGVGPIVVADVPATAGGTRIEVPIPAAAMAGDLAVRVPGTQHSKLSNVFPFDPAREPWSPPRPYGTPGVASGGTQVELDWIELPSLTAGSMRLVVGGGDSLGFGFGVLVVGTTPGPLATVHGPLFVGGRLLRAAPIFLFAGGGVVELDLTTLAPRIGDTLYVTCWLPDGGSSGGVFSDALEITTVE